jgi:1,2-diacylglycerol 3-beta-galactosyltransferase
VRRILCEPTPDLVVSVHPVFNALPRRVLHEVAPQVPFVTVVTDLFDAHRMWFDRDVDLCIVPTEGARKKARRFGMPADKLRVVGQPISLGFLGDLKPKAEYRAKLGLETNVTTILLIGGGEGMGKLYDIACALDRLALSIQLVIITGRNRALYEQLRAKAWQISVSVQGFVTNMPEWMRASDLIITKAGPGTIMEALACNLPILLSGFLPGQETGNVTFVVQNGVGVLEQNPDAMARTIKGWLAPGNETLRRFSARAKELARPSASLDIAKILNDIVVAHQSRA